METTTEIECKINQIILDWVYNEFGPKFSNLHKFIHRYEQHVHIRIPPLKQKTAVFIYIFAKANEQNKLRIDIHHDGLTSNKFDISDPQFFQKVTKILNKYTDHALGIGDENVQTNNSRPKRLGKARLNTNEILP